MTPSVYLDNNKTISKQFCEAFAAGAGIPIADIVKDCKTRPGPWAGYGSPRLWDSLTEKIKAGEDFYYGDHAYFGRNKFFRVTKNAYQHNGIGEPDFERLRPFHRHAKRWKRGGGHILVCTQTQGYYDRFAIPDWLEQTLARLDLYTDRPIRVREKGTKVPLAEDFIDCHCVVVCSSNVAVEAIMQGIPAICTNECAASIMSLRDPALVEYPYYPEGRMEWAGVLAANQWTFDEIKRGKCWEHVQ